MQPEATPFTQKHGLQPLSAVNGMPDRAHYSCMNGSSPEKTRGRRPQGILTGTAPRDDDWV